MPSALQRLILSETNDLIYEGIATSGQHAHSCTVSSPETNDLIYEGIATRVQAIETIHHIKG